MSRVGIIVSQWCGLAKVQARARHPNRWHRTFSHSLPARRTTYHQLVPDVLTDQLTVWHSARLSWPLASAHLLPDPLVCLPGRHCVYTDAYSRVCGASPHMYRPRIAVGLICCRGTAGSSSAKDGNELVISDLNATELALRN